MSASIGEPGHESSGLAHAICDSCYLSRHDQKDWNCSPTRMRAADADGNVHPTDYETEPCCYCGQPTRGIYVRAPAPEVHAA